MPTQTTTDTGLAHWRELDDPQAHQARIAAELAADFTDPDTTAW